MTDRQIEYARRYYAEHREEILAKQKAAYKAKVKKKKQVEYKRKWNAEHMEEQCEKRRAKWQARNTEEFREERRRKYAEKHKDYPMTEHRKRCIEAQKERMTMTLEERKARILADKAKKAALKDMKESGFIQSEDESERNRETVIKYIRQWTKRKVFTAQDLRDGDRMAEADVVAYHKEACKYFELRERMDKTDPRDYSNRNILGYKMRVIEDHFNTLLNKRINTRSKLKEE